MKLILVSGTNIFLVGIHQRELFVTAYKVFGALLVCPKFLMVCSQVEIGREMKYLFC